MARPAWAWALLLLAAAALCSAAPHVSGGPRGLTPPTVKPAGGVAGPSITNGKPAPIGRYRYMASLRLNNDVNFPYCGGTLIHPQVVLTAGHCLTDPYTGKNYSAPGYQPLLVRVGGYWRVEEPSSKAELFTVVRQVVNPAFHVPFTPPLTYNFLNNDMALLLLDRPSTMPVIRLIGPPTPAISKPNNPVPDFANVTVMGWGLDEWFQYKFALQEVEQQVLPLAVCQAAWGTPDPPWTDDNNEPQPVYNTFWNNSMMCAAGNLPSGDKSFCPGDSGGPLIVRGAHWTEDVQIGTVSFVSGDCKGIDVYADVSQTWHWINSTLFALTGNYLNEPFKRKEGSVVGEGPLVRGFNGSQFYSIQPTAPPMPILRTPQYDISARLAAAPRWQGWQVARTPLPQNSTIMTGVSFIRGQTAVWAFLYANPPRLALQLNGAGLLPGTKTAIPGGTLEFAQFRWGANRRVTVEQGDLTLHITQAFSRSWQRYMHWLEVWVTLKSCPQPPVSGVLGSTLPLCTYRGA